MFPDLPRGPDASRFTGGCLLWLLKMFDLKANNFEPVAIIEEFYDSESRIYKILRHHVRLVEEKALEIAAGVPYLNPDLDFISEAAVLHDIGIYLTDTPMLDCFGRYPYIAHGYLGRKLLEERGLPKHALVCERHVGVGITLKDIKDHKLPLPARNMCPVSIEEQIICYADKFFSKDAHLISREKSMEDVLQGIEKYGPDKLAQFKAWATLFGKKS